MIQLTFHLFASEFSKESRNFFKFIHTLFKRAKQDCSSSTLSPYKRRRRKVTKANPQYTHTHIHTQTHILGLETQTLRSFVQLKTRST